MYAIVKPLMEVPLFLCARFTLVTQKAELAVEAASLSSHLVRLTRGWRGWVARARMVWL